MSELLLADSPPPVIDAGWAILLLSRVLHLTCAGLILGGLVYLKRVVAPLATGADDVDDAIYRGRRSAWAGLVMIATTFLLLSGFLNLYYIVTGSEDLPPTYHMLFGIKFLLAMFVFFVAAGTAGASPLAVKMRGNLQRWLNLAIGATLLIFILASVLRSFDKVPRTLDEAETAAYSATDHEIHG